MEMDVNRQRRHNGANLMTISARCCANNNNGNTTSAATAAAAAATAAAATTTTTATAASSNGCCGILSRLFCVSRHKATQSVAGSDCHTKTLTTPTTLTATTATPTAATQSRRSRRTPQEIYFESRGKSCKKLLKFNGNSNKILLYPEEGWARTASSSYWTITPCWWQPNRCRIVEYAGTQRQATKARMLPMEQQGSLLIAGHFRRTAAAAAAAAASASTTTSSTSAAATIAATAAAMGDRGGAGAAAAGGGGVGGGRGAIAAAGNGTKSKSDMAYNDEFKLYLTSNISMEDYNMGYCLTGFVERRCQLTNTFQMTHFAVIKRQWPPPSTLT